MKKKAIILGALLLATVVTGFSVSGTYAKYVSSVDTEDEARVAMWGVNLGDIELDLFKDTYLLNSTDNTTYYAQSNEDVDRDGDGTYDNIVAPGTSGQYEFQIDFGGTAPEVNYKLNIEAEGVDKVNTYLDNYQPIVYTLDGKDFYTIEELAKAIEDLASDKIYAAGTLPTNGELKKHTISWKWAFDSSEDEYIDDEKDTELGNAIITDDLSVSLSIKVTAVQVKEAA